MSDRLKQLPLLWWIAAILIGGALPMMIFGRAVSQVWLVLGLGVGFIAMGPEALAKAAWQKFCQGRMRWALLALLGTYAISAIFALDPEDAWEQWGKIVLFLGVTLGLARVLEAAPWAAVRLALLSLCLGSVTLALYIIGNVLWVPEQPFELSFNVTTLRNIQDRFSFYSSLFAVLAPLVWAALLRWRYTTPRHGVWALLLALVFMVVVIVAGGRAGWLGLLAGTAIFGAGLWWYHGAKWWRIALFCVLGLGAGLATYAAGHGTAYFQHRFGNFGGSYETAGSGRLPIWQYAVENLHRNPLTGIGMNGYRELPPPPYHVNSRLHPHNFVLQLLLEVGLLGTLATAAVVALMYWRLWRYVQVSLYAVGGLSAMTAFWVCALTNTNIFGVRWLIVLVVVYLLSYRLCRQGKAG